MSSRCARAACLSHAAPLLNAPAYIGATVVYMQQTVRFPLVLLTVYALIWTALAIAPLYRQDWLLENILVFLLVPWLLWSFRTTRFSNQAYACFFVFLTLHAIGAHYTYSLVPYDQWIQCATGRSLNAALGIQRNQYDRFMHLLYGLLIAVPARELILRRSRPHGLWMFLLPWTFMLSHAVIYELIEWLAAAVFGGPLGQAYLGTQGDVWDAQKDMIMALIGATVTLAWLSARDRNHVLRERHGNTPAS
jgi:putative membrane protein